MEKADEAVRVTLAARNPESIAAGTASLGVKKARRPVYQVLILAALAGIYIGFGGMFSIVAGAALQNGLPHGAVQVLSGAVFSLGLALVILGGAELFTGNTLMVMSVAEERISSHALLRSWILVWTANLVGALALVVVTLLAGFHLAGDGAVGLKALATAESKAAKPFVTAFASGILANMLVCLAVWLAASGRTSSDKLLALFLPVAAFVAMELEHSVANMFLIPLGLAILDYAGPEFWSLVAKTGNGTGLTVGPANRGALDFANASRNIAAATLGNMVGGALIGMSYWLAFRSSSSKRR